MKKYNSEILLLIWVVPLAITGLVILLVGLHIEAGERFFIQYNLDRIEEFSQLPEDGDLKVFAFGSSLTRDGILYDHHFSEFANDTYCQSIHFLRICRPGHDLGKFEPFLDDILKNQPDFILLESGMLYFDTSVGFFEGTKRFLLNFVRRGLRFSRISRVKMNLTFNAPPATQGYVRKANRPAINLIKKLRSMRGWNTIQFNKQLKWHQFFEKAEEKGIKIVILDFPYPDKYEKKLTNIQPLPFIRKMREHYKDNYGLVYWKHPGAFEESNFYDFSHLNPAGRQVFSGWLVEKMDSVKL